MSSPVLLALAMLSISSWPFFSRVKDGEGSGNVHIPNMAVLRGWEGWEWSWASKWKKKENQLWKNKMKTKWCRWQGVLHPDCVLFLLMSQCVKSCIRWAVPAGADDVDEGEWAHVVTIAPLHQRSVLWGEVSSASWESVVPGAGGAGGGWEGRHYTTQLAHGCAQWHHSER